MRYLCGTSQWRDCRPLKRARGIYMKLRVKFKKYGPVRFIGHLDVMRYFQKTIRRAGIDVSYSMGFSPHQIMSFAAPLGVGLTSNGEYMDIEVNSLPEPREGFTACQTVVQKLNEAGVKGLDVVDVRILPESAGNAMASVAAASYTVRFRPGRLPVSEDKPMADFSFQQMCDNLLKCDQIMITKETKRGSREVDLRPGIYRLVWENNGFYMLLDASSSGNIKPAQVMEAMFSDNGSCLQTNSLLVTREDVFTRNNDLIHGMKRPNGHPYHESLRSWNSDGETWNFVSLGDIGYIDDSENLKEVEIGGVS